MKDEFAERAVREQLEKIVLAVIQEKPFLEVTTSPEWVTLDGLVEALDAADYWHGEGWSNVTPPPEPPSTPAGKRKYVRGMLEHLSAYLSAYRDADDPSASAEKVFVSRFRATESGGLERVFKVASLCSKEELEELQDDHDAAADYYHIRSQELKDSAQSLQRGGEESLSLPEFYMQELNESTMYRAWPKLDEEDRGWVIVVGVKLRQAKNKLTERLLHDHKEGRTPTFEQVQEHIRRGSLEMWREIVEDLARRLGWSEDDAKRFVDQLALQIYSSEFAEALDSASNDEFGWTLDEHLQFVVDERELD